MPWNPCEKPPADVCPREYCFNWLEGGSLFAPGLYANFAGATRHPRPVLAGSCGWTLGVCVRRDPVCGDHDYYEPDGSRLAREGLPWFYFHPNEELLIPKLRAMYREESRRLWGSAPEPDQS